MPGELSFISDERLAKLVRELVASYQSNTEEVNIHKNVIDPFTATYDAMLHNISIEAWFSREKARQMIKKLEALVGYFHQKVIGSMPGWEDTGARGGGYDVINRDMKILAEIKNKHNTMNSGKTLEVYDSLGRHIDYNFREFTAYLVQIVPKSKTPYDKPLRASEAGTPRLIREDIRKIDGKSFYTLITGDDLALSKLYAKLPGIISEVIGIAPDLVTEGDEFLGLFRKAYGDSSIV